MPDHDPQPELVERVRASSRQMVRELGFLQASLAATGYPPSAVHAILEIGAQQALTAAQLAGLLQLEKSSVSRMVRKLIDAGEVRETASTGDARSKRLALTAKGRRTLAAIDAFGQDQVAQALKRLPATGQALVGKGLAAYAAALESRRLDKPLAGEYPAPAMPAEILRGYRPGAIGQIVGLHADFYARNFGFGQFFESLVASGLAQFAPRLANPRNQLWLAMDDGVMAGSVAIDGEDLGGNTAHLRWFILGDNLRGTGMGRKLLDEALAFCDGQGFEATQLWTFKGLDAARRLYEAAGFVLADEQPGRQWGSEVVEQRFVRPRHAPSR